MILEKKNMLIIKEIHINKYNDVYQFLKDNNYIPDKFKLKNDKGFKKLLNKKTNFP